MKPVRSASRRNEQMVFHVREMHSSAAGAAAAHAPERQHHAPRMRSQERVDPQVAFASRAQHGAWALSINIISQNRVLLPTHVEFQQIAIS